MLRILLISLLLPGLSSCTWLVLQDAASTVCADDDDCGAGSQCEGDVCVASEVEAPPAAGTVVDDAGGVVVGPDDVTLTIPPGAISGATVFVIARETATLPHDNFDASSGFFTITPARDFAVAATLRVTGEGALFQRPADDGGTWIPFDGAGDDVDIDSTGTFARGALVEAP
jgi:hypothetical protein